MPLDEKTKEKFAKLPCFNFIDGKPCDVNGSGKCVFSHQSGTILSFLSAHLLRLLQSPPVKKDPRFAGNEVVEKALKLSKELETTSLERMQELLKGMQDKVERMKTDLDARVKAGELPREPRSGSPHPSVPANQPSAFRSRESGGSGGSTPSPDAAAGGANNKY
jgi:hypothetical protein